MLKNDKKDSLIKYEDNKNFKDIQNLILKLSDINIDSKYDNESHEEIKKVLTDIADKTGRFDYDIEKEKCIVDKDLTETKNHTNLIDKNTLEQRIKNVLQENNIFSCLKSLALTNKCAHYYDKNLHQLKEWARNTFVLMTNSQKFNSDIFGLPGNTKDFFDKYINLDVPLIESKFKNYNLEQLSQDDFSFIITVLFDDKSKVEAMKRVLIKLNVISEKDRLYQIDKGSDETAKQEVRDRIRQKFNDVKLDKEVIGYFHFKRLHENAQFLVNLENLMFGVKDSFISLIANVLTYDDSYKKIKYELIYTPDAPAGFQYMFVIDDPDLQYYVEVHMSNQSAYEYIKNYGMKVEPKRQTLALGASAVYHRVDDEIKNVFEALNEGYIIDSAETRAKIITRGYIPNTDNSLTANNNDSDTYTEKHNNKNLGGINMKDSDDSIKSKNYSLEVQNSIKTQEPLFEQFLKEKYENKEVINFNKNMQLNENIPAYYTKNIVLKNYVKLYKSFNQDTKESFLTYSFKKLKNGDEFDKKLAYILCINYDFEYAGLILIYKEVLKGAFDYYTNNEKNYDTKFIENYISDFIAKIKIPNDFDEVSIQYIKDYLENFNNPKPTKSIRIPIVSKKNKRKENPSGIIIKHLLKELEETEIIKPRFYKDKESKKTKPSLPKTEEPKNKPPHKK